MRWLQLLVFDKHTGECSPPMDLVCPYAFSNGIVILPGISTMIS